MALSPEERLSVSAEALKRRGDDTAGVVITSEEIARYIGDWDKVKDKDVDEVIGVIIYIQKRMVEKLGRVPSFKHAFPGRCVRTGDGPYKGTAEHLNDGTIHIKAVRLEQKSVYKQVLLYMNTSLHVSYLIERLQVLDAALDVALDEDANLRDRHNYMKLFLDETRKPEKIAAGMEFNVNLTQNNVSIQHVEDKLDNISRQFMTIGADAEEIIDAISYKPENATIADKQNAEG
jgi:hypothetical protein